ncbi:putative double-strand break repair protein MRE11A [Apostichopus japonicus]|uniref:Putative double-strand break repair protein MRE11A n=1 Tax=Stichopus japonicus TaxID=307972 RepID=A0A2G8KEJ6_STIJA|nr:putative double-strand break repair protein MRE11A [Apostichopus japonicus]
MPKGGTNDTRDDPEDEENTFKILVVIITIATDCHLGYMEKDSVRTDDSLNTFEEIYSMRRKRRRDLYHDNKPSRKSLHCSMALLRQYCMGTIRSSLNFSVIQALTSRQILFCRITADPNMNVDMPVFSIHGNHDDPAGLGNLCALDVLSIAGLVNYFGKSPSLEDVKISPILLRKGRTKLALYGLGSIRDERLHRMFLQGKVSMLQPKENRDSWFNLFVIHQNRAKHGEHNYIPEQFLNEFIDLVVWGHEHECLVDPVWNPTQNFFISQPGSSIATSLSHGEAVKKHVALLQVRNKEMKCTKIPLETVRQFYIEDVCLLDTDLDPADVHAEKKVEKYCAAKIEELISKAVDEHSGNPKQPKLPLVRLRVDYSGGFSTFNVNRFGQQFSNKVANPKDLILFNKKKEARTKSDR